jgi:hypothetical protein
MNQELYIDLLENEVERLRKENRDLEYKVQNAKELYCPATQLAKTMEKETIAGGGAMSGIAAIIENRKKDIPLITNRRKEAD